MNLLILFSSISTLLSSAFVPINSDNLPSNSLNNTTECYYYDNSLNLKTAKNISDIFANVTTNKQHCKTADDVCGVIVRRRKDDKNHQITMQCIKPARCFVQQPSIWNNLLDYDYPYTMSMRECCEGNLCNTIDNLPNTQKVLYNSAKTAEENDVLCPGFSDNHKIINLRPQKYYKINVNECDNLLITSRNVEHLIYKNSKKDYTGTVWRKNYFKGSLITFSPKGKVYKWTTNKKIFYVTANVMHICNFTKEDNIFYLVNNNRLVGEEDVMSIVKFKYPDNNIVPNVASTSIMNTKNQQHNAVIIIHNTTYGAVVNIIITTLLSTKVIENLLFAA